MGSIQRKPHDVGARGDSDPALLRLHGDSDLQASGIRNQDIDGYPALSSTTLPIYRYLAASYLTLKPDVDHDTDIDFANAKKQRGKDEKELERQDTGLNA